MVLGARVFPPFSKSHSSLLAQNGGEWELKCWKSVCRHSGVFLLVITTVGRAYPGDMIQRVNPLPADELIKARRLGHVHILEVIKNLNHVIVGFYLDKG